jgi:glycosyltransferase involved in cell wall biosynthesis
MPKIKILHIIKSLGRGGAEMLLQETLKVHDKEKFEFHFIYFLPWKNQMVAGIEHEGGIVSLFSANNNLTIMLKVPEIIRYIKKNKIDIVHAHLPWAGFASRIIYKISEIPVVYSENNIQNRYHFITKSINKITFNWQTKVIAVSGDVAASIQKNIKPKIPIQIILNGVNTSEFKRSSEAREIKRNELGLKSDDILIGNIAVFRFQKRLKEWIDIVKEIQSNYPNIKACIIGDGILKEEIISYLKEKQMLDKIILPGLQTDVKPWLSAIDIFMMSSSFEGLPIALLEAMSMQCAIVTTDAGGIKELIRNKQDGFITEVQNWKNLVEPLSQLAQKKSLIDEYGMNARKRVEVSFSMNAMVSQLETTYFDLFNKKKNQ